jgi:DcaP outer membrane protein
MEDQMPSLLRAFVLFCAFLMLGVPTRMRSQSADQNAEKIQANSEKIQALQKELDEMKAQMQAVQAEILDLSKASTTPRAPNTSVSISAKTSSTGTPAEEESATEAAKLSLVSARRVGKTTASYQTGTGPPAEEESATEAAKLNLVPARQVDKTTASYQTDSQDQIAAPRIDNAPLDPRYPGYFRLPGTQTLLRIGGYFKTDFIYDLKPAGNTDSFIPSSFPIPSPGGVNNTTVSVRPTRMNLDFLIPVSSTSVRFFIEFDMFGTNATTPRLRHAYAQVKNILLGQTFSNFMDPDSGPDTLDFQGPNAQISIRNPQLRYTIPLAKQTSLSLSVEKASSDIAFTTPTFNALPNSPSPDGAIKFRQEFSKGHLQISALMRAPSAYLPNGVSESVFGWGIDVTGALKTFGQDVFVYQGAYGAGMERYVNDTSGLGFDAAPTDPARPHLEAIPMVATYGGYQHYWSKPLRSSVVYGYVQAENTSLEPNSAFHRSQYTAVNLIWNPFGSLNVGTEFLYGSLVEKNNGKADAPRIIVSAKYNFIKTAPTK